MRQRGFAISLILWGLAALAIVTAVGAVVWKYNSAIERAVKAEAQLAECSQKYDQALASIAKQNSAIADWQKAARDSSERAAKALQKARAAQGASQSERERLKRLQAEFKPGVCPAGQAVQDVRRGLNP